MRLYILRHGDAVERDDPRYRDAERPLTAKGQQRTRQLARLLRRMDVALDAILSSPLARARETAEVVAAGLEIERPVQLSGNLSPSGSMENLVLEIGTIRPVPEAVLLVGHEPYLSSFISLLCTGGPGLALTLKKGALCRLEVGALACSKCADLEWVLPPRLLGLKPRAA